MDVSKLSSWLNTNADWRVKGREGVHDAKRGAGREAGGRVERCGGGASGMHGGRPRLGEGPRLGACGGQGAHVEHSAHVRDLGGVEAAERLVEYSRVLPRVEREGVHDAERGAGREAGGRGTRCGGASGMHGGRRRLGEGPRLGACGGQGAHSEHGAHARDLGGVQAAERLVE